MIGNERFYFVGGWGSEKKMFSAFFGEGGAGKRLELGKGGGGVAVLYICSIFLRPSKI